MIDIQYTENYAQLLTRGIFNCRASSKLRGCGSLQVHPSLKGKNSETGNKTYHHRCNAGQNILIKPP